MKKTKSFVVSVLIIIYILGVVPRQNGVILADEVIDPSPSPTASPDPSPDPTPDPTPDPSSSPDPSPTPTPEPTPSPTSSPDPTPDPSPTPTPDPSVEPQSTALADPSPSPTPCPTNCDDEPQDITVEQTNDADISNDVQSQAETGNTTVNSSGPASTAETGDANAEVTVINMANTNSANSQTDFQVETVLGDQTGDINLVDASSQAPDPSLLLINQTNTATVTNYILVYANSGWNLVDGLAGNVQTGAAYAVVNVFNFINANLANSQISFAIINIFGSLNGNIVLPDPSQLAVLLGGNNNINQQNNAIVLNSVSQSAVSGNNILTGDGTVQSGDAINTANVLNNINSNALGSAFYHLIVNNFGTWNGIFAGWGNLGAQDSQEGTMFFDIDNLLPVSHVANGGETDQSNNANVTNTIIAQSSTGNNTVNGAGNIKSGNAYSMVNLLNFINSNWASSRGFFGLVNIMGTLNGNIGGKTQLDALAALSNPMASTTQDPQNDAVVDVHGSGGQLASTMSTNVGTHVNPGDTVMFFIKVLNPGTGSVYDAKLTFNLLDSNGEIANVQTYNLGNINPGGKRTVSFGLVLAKNVPGGTYVGLSQAVGTTGPDDSGLSSSNDTQFNVSGTLAQVFEDVTPVVKGAGKIDLKKIITEKQGGIYYSEIWGNVFLLLLFLTYIRMLQLLYKKRENDILIEQTPKTD